MQSVYRSKAVEYLPRYHHNNNEPKENQLTYNCFNLTSRSQSSHTGTNTQPATSLDNELVNDAVQFGFAKDFVCKLVERKLRSGKKYLKLLELVEDLQAEEPSSSESSSSTLSPTLSPAPSRFSSLSEVSSDGIVDRLRPEDTVNCNHPIKNNAPFPRPAGVVLMEGLKKAAPSQVGSSWADQPANEECFLEEERCKVCLDRRVDAMFTPCAHLCCCLECAEALRRCPLCRAKLEKVIKIYRN